MADGVTVKVRRKDELLRKLQRLAPETQEGLEKATGEAAREMVSLARSFVPARTGALRESIVATPPGQTPPAYAQGGSAVPPGAHAVTAGNTRVRYAHLVEYGTKPHINAGLFAGSQHPGTPPRPFFWTAFRLIRKRFKGRATRAMRKAIKAVTSK